MSFFTILKPLISVSCLHSCKTQIFQNNISNAGDDGASYFILNRILFHGGISPLNVMMLVVGLRSFQ